jgi:DNA-binding MarR family transcriptional regulator
VLFYKFFSHFSTLYRSNHPFISIDISYDKNTKQALIIEILKQKGPQRITDLAEALNITLPSVAT